MAADLGCGITRFSNGREHQKIPKNQRSSEGPGALKSFVSGLVLSMSKRPQASSLQSDQEHSSLPKKAKTSPNHENAVGEVKDGASTLDNTHLPRREQRRAPNLPNRCRDGPVS